MTLLQLGVFAALGLLFGALPRGAWRGWALLILSVVALFWLQPALPVRWLDFWLPAATLAIVGVCWGAVRTRGPLTRDDVGALALSALLTVALAATRALAPPWRVTASLPPDVPSVLAGVGVALAVGALLTLLRRPARGAVLVPGLVLGALVGLFVVLRTDALAAQFASVIRGWVGQNRALASPFDVRWLGFSYIAFRLIHTLRDRQMGILPALGAREYLTYALFFPALPAGPIDRAERFVADLRALPSAAPRDPDRLVAAGRRIASGLLKKFVIADALALFALDAANAALISSTGGAWALTVAYAFRLYYDFSGYTDIALGLGLLFGIALPDNFARPYQADSLTSFWQRWHITLSAWARTYVFAPLSKALLRRKAPLTLAALVCISATMLTIGLWHGVTWPFVLWGLWHALGLWAHKLYTDRTRGLYRRLKARPRALHALSAAGTVLTFVYVTLGWVWFALPSVPLALGVFGLLFGLEGAVPR